MRAFCLLTTVYTICTGLINGRLPQKKYKKMEDNLKKNGRQPQKNRRRPQQKKKKNGRRPEMNKKRPTKNLDSS
jgi:hypothetical protein